MITSTKEFLTSELAQRVNGTLRGPGEIVITGVQAIADAGPNDITFITSGKYGWQWGKSRAAAAVVTKGVEPTEIESAKQIRPLIFVPDADVAMIQLLELFQPLPLLPELGVHPTAFVHPSVSLGKGVRIGPHVSIDANSSIGDGAVLFAGAQIYQQVQIGAGSIIHGCAVIQHNCKIGRGVILHQNVSIGADGFGYRPNPNGAGLLKVPHIGNVIIEDGVEIGANTCVDRAKFGSTIIAAGAKLDNLCQIGHNARIGRCTVIAACAAISGSVIIGDGVQLGVAVGVSDHITIGNGAKIGALAFVMRDVPAGETYLGYPADEAQSVLRQWASVRKLPSLVRRFARQAQMDERP